MSRELRTRFVVMTAIAAFGVAWCLADANAAEKRAPTKPSGGFKPSPGGGNNGNNHVIPNSDRMPTRPGRDFIPEGSGNKNFIPERGPRNNNNIVIPNIDINRFRRPENNIIPDYVPNRNNIIPDNYVPSRPIPSNTIPETNTIPEANNIPPLEIKPAQNFALLELQPMSRTQTKGLLQLADDQATQSAKDINDFVAPVTDPAEMLGEVKNDPNWNNLNAQQQKEVEDALKAQPPDPDAVRKAMDNKGLNQGTIDKMVSRTDIAKKNQELQDLVKNGGTQDQIKAKTEELQQSLDNAANIGAITYDPASRAGMRDLADKLQQAAGIRDAVIDYVNGNSTLPGGNMPFPTGTVTIIYDPQIPAGEVVALSANVLVVGTGQGGRLGVTDGTAEDAGLPSVQGDPLNNATNDDAGMGGGKVLVMNPEGSRGKVNYTVNGEAFTLEPNQQQELNNGDNIAFDRGGGNGRAQYRLEDGRYEFNIGKNGWDLNSLPAFAVTLDNRANPYDFNFVLDNQRRTVKARETTTLQSKSLMTMAFDNGRGETIRKVLDGDGTLKVGVNPDTRALDVFMPTAETAANEPKNDTPQPKNERPQPKGQRAGSTKPPAIGDR